MGDENANDYESWVDSRYAWLVIVPSTFMVAFGVMGVQYSAGVINSAVLAEFNESEGMSAWVTAIAIGVLLLAMGPGGTIQAYIGFRLTVVIGGVLTVAGLLASSAATHIWHLYLSYGLLAGTGQGFAYLAAVSVVQVWFSPEHRAMAAAVASAGSGIGTIVLGTLTEKLIDAYDWKTGFYFCSGVSAVCIFIPAFFLTSPPTAPTEAKEKPQPPPFVDVITAPGLPYFMLCLFVFGFGGWNPVVHNAELYVQHNFDATVASNLISVGFGIGSVVGRPLAAWVLGITGRRQGFPGILALMAVVCALNPLMGGNDAQASGDWGKAWIFINNMLYGFAFGAFISVLPPITAELVGMQKFPAALGLVYASFGISMMVGPPLCGYWAAAYDTLDYDNSYYTSGGVMMIGALMSIACALYDNQLAPPVVAVKAEEIPEKTNQLEMDADQQNSDHVTKI